MQPRESSHWERLQYSVEGERWWKYHWSTLDTINPFIQHPCSLPLFLPSCWSREVKHQIFPNRWGITVTVNSLSRRKFLSFFLLLFPTWNLGLFSDRKRRAICWGIVGIQEARVLGAVLSSCTACTPPLDFLLVRNVTVGQAFSGFRVRHPYDTSGKKCLGLRGLKCSPLGLRHPHLSIGHSKDHLGLWKYSFAVTQTTLF